MDVRLPDGTILKNVPEGTTKAQIAEKLGMAQPSTMSKEVDALRQAGDIAASYLQGRSFGLAPKIASGVGSVIAKPILESAEMVGMLPEGSTPSLGEMYKQGVDMYSAPAKRAREESPVLSTLAELGGGLKTGIGLSKTGVSKNVADWASKGGGLTSLGKKSLAGALAGDIGYRTYEAGNAPVGQELSAIKNASFIPGVIGGAIPGVGAAGGKLVGTAKKLLKPPPQIQGNISKSAKKYYDVFDEISGGLPADQVKAISMKINSIRPKDPAQAALWDSSGAQDVVNLFNNATQSGKLTFRGLQALRSDVNSKIKQAYNNNNDTLASSLLKVKEQMTKALSEADLSSVTDVEMKNAWKMANHEFSKEALLDELDLITAKASTRAQPANSIDTAINNFLSNKKLSKGLLPKERLALENVTKQTGKSELLKSGATRLLSTVGAAKAGPVGFLAGHYGAKFVRDQATGLKLRKLDQAFDIIRNRKAPDLEKYVEPLKLTNQRRSTLERNIEKRRSYEASKGESRGQIRLGQDKPAELLALPAPNKEMWVNQLGESISPSSDDLYRASLQRQSLEQLGITPDVMRAIDANEARNLEKYIMELPPKEAKKFIELLRKKPIK